MLRPGLTGGGRGQEKKNLGILLINSDNTANKIVKICITNGSWHPDQEREQPYPSQNWSNYVWHIVSSFKVHT